MARYKLDYDKLTDTALTEKLIRLKEMYEASKLACELPETKDAARESLLQEVAKFLLSPLEEVLDD